MATIIGRCGGGCTGIIDSTATAGDDCGVHSVGASAGSVLTADGAGGSTWGGATALEEHLISGVTALPAFTATTLSWSRYDGNILVDLTNPQHIKVLGNGLYGAGLGAQIGGGGGGTFGDQFDVTLGCVQSVLAWPPGNAAPGRSSFTWPNNALDSLYVSVSTPTAKMFGALDFWQVVVSNLTGTAYTLNSAGVSIVKIAGF